MNTTKPCLKLKSAYLIYIFLLFGNIAFAQDDDVTECPYFNVSSTDSTGVVFSLLSTNIDATVSGVISNVVIEQVYTNSGDSIVDATYVFPMSTNAAIYGMEMDVNDRTIVAEIRRKSEAQEIFEIADSLGQTASLLEQERPNVFQMSLSNINPWDTIKVRMVYTELLVPTNGVYQFVFPNIVGPRFTTGGEPWVYQTILDSIPLSETDLNIQLKINAGTPLSAESPSHPATFTNQGNSTETILSTKPGGDFIVNYTLDDNEIETGILLYEDSTENFFLSMIQPARPNIPFVSPEREYIFIMDVSGSMTGEPIEVSKELIINLLHDLRPEDRFNILFFAGGSSVLSPNSLAVTDENIDLAIDMIDNLNAGGSTQLLPAMDRALAMEGTRGFSRTFVILTDGFVSVEKATFELIRENLNEANFFSFGIGNFVNRFIIEGIAYVGEGEPFVVGLDDDPRDVADTFKEYIERPALTNIEATFEDIEVYNVEPLTVPDVFAERPIIIYGKYRNANPGKVTLQGDHADGIVTSTLSFADFTANSDENIALKYLWARKRIRLMSDYGIASNETDSICIEEEITLLGLKYSLVTEFTSFVAVDSLALTGDPNTETGNDSDDGTILVDVLDQNSNLDSEKEIITVIGTINESEGILRLRIENLNPIANENLTLQITNLNGKIVKYQSLGQIKSEDMLSISLGRLPAGIYFVSLVNSSNILETEKFIIR